MQKVEKHSVFSFKVVKSYDTVFVCLLGQEIKSSPRVWKAYAQFFSAYTDSDPHLLF